MPAHVYLHVIRHAHHRIGRRIVYQRVAHCRIPSGQLGRIPVVRLVYPVIARRVHIQIAYVVQQAHVVGVVMTIYTHKHRALAPGIGFVYYRTHLVRIQRAVQALKAHVADYHAGAARLLQARAQPLQLLARHISPAAAVAEVVAEFIRHPSAVHVAVVCAHNDNAYAVAFKQIIRRRHIVSRQCCGQRRVVGIMIAQRVIRRYAACVIALNRFAGPGVTVHAVAEIACVYHEVDSFAACGFDHNVQFAPRRVIKRIRHHVNVGKQQKFASIHLLLPPYVLQTPSVILHTCPPRVKRTGGGKKCRLLGQRSSCLSATERSGRQCAQRHIADIPRSRPCGRLLCLVRSSLAYLPR